MHFENCSPKMAFLKNTFLKTASSKKSNFEITLSKEFSFFEIAFSKLLSQRRHFQKRFKTALYFSSQLSEQLSK